MTNPYAASYAATQKATLSGRDVERALLLRLAARLEADPTVPGGAAALASALQDNRRVWEAFAADLARPSNPYPDALKASLIGLAAFVARHTVLVARGEASAAPLAEIDRNVAGGLDAQRLPAAA